MANSFPQQSQDSGELDLIKPTHIMFIRAQNKNYDKLRKNKKFKHVKDPTFTGSDIVGIKRVMKKLGAKKAHRVIIDLVDADYLEFEVAMT